METAPLLSLHIGGKYPPQSRFKPSRFKKVPKRTKKKNQKEPKKYQEEPKTTEKNQKGAAPLSSLHIGEVHILLSQTINQLKESPSSPLFTPFHFMGWAIL